VARIAAQRTLEGLAPGGSIAVDGCCLTAVEVEGGAFTCELTPETVARTAFGRRLAPGARVNLERPMPASGRFDGHIVQGHVDGVGTVRGLRREGGEAELEVGLPSELERYVVEKGSIAVDGVSLTVAGVAGGVFRVALIPYTLEHTNLGEARAGGPVNLEVDVIAKYVERLLGAGRR
jgi:riboflavin synthase